MFIYAITVVVILLVAYLVFHAAKKSEAQGRHPALRRAKRKKVHVYSIRRITAGGLHAWCESNVGLIRKPTNAPELRGLEAPDEGPWRYTAAPMLPFES
jgi:hypothetical protein